MSLATTSFLVDVRRGDLASVKRVLAHQPGVLHGRSGADLRTPLHVAAEVGNHLMLRTLLQHGAGYAVPDAAGEVPLMLAARQVRAEDMDCISSRPCPRTRAWPQCASA